MTGFGQFDRKNWVWSILAKRSGFRRFRPKNVGLVDFDCLGSFGVIWGFPMSFLTLKLKIYFSDLTSGPTGIRTWDLRRESRACYRYDTSNFTISARSGPVTTEVGDHLGTKPQ